MAHKLDYFSDRANASIKEYLVNLQSSLSSHILMYVKLDVILISLIVASYMFFILEESFFFVSVLILS